MADGGGPDHPHLHRYQGLLQLLPQTRESHEDGNESGRGASLGAGSTQRQSSSLHSLLRGRPTTSTLAASQGRKRPSEFGEEKEIRETTPMKHQFPPVPPEASEGDEGIMGWVGMMKSEDADEPWSRSNSEFAASPPKSPWRNLLRIPSQWMGDWMRKQREKQDLPQFEPRKEGLPKRADLAVVRTRRKASIKEAAAIAKEAGPGSQHIADLEKSFSAASSKASVASKRETIQKILAALPICNTTFPLDVYKVKALAAVLLKAGYTSAEGYLVEAKCVHIEGGWDWTPQLDRFFKMAKRACVRGKGPERRAPEVRIEKWWTKKLGVGRSPAAVMFPNELFVLAACFLLREVELAAFCVESLLVDRARQQVCLRWDVSKTDQEAKGIQRVLQCQCKSFICSSSCPFKVADDLLAKLRAKGLDPSGLCWNRRRQRATKSQIVATWSKIYGTKVTGHSPRRSGTMRYLREGWSIAQISYLGRWKSAVVYKYAEEALAELPALSESEKVITINQGGKEGPQVKPEELQKLRDLWTATATKVEKYKADSKTMSKELKEEISVLKSAAKNQGMLPRKVKALLGGKVHHNAPMPVFTPAIAWKTRCGWHFGCGSFIFLHEGEVTCEKCASFALEQEGGKGAKDTAPAAN